MDKNLFAPVPPMGWNSYDYYDTTVTEEDVKKNADYLAKNLKKFGYEYVVIDIEWYSNAAGTKRDTYQYIPFEDFEIDEYSRLQPSHLRFPSSANGKGFKPLADYIHGLGHKRKRVGYRRRGLDLRLEPRYVRREAQRRRSGVL